MRFPVYSINIIIRDYNNLLFRAGIIHILLVFSMKLHRDPLNYDSGVYTTYFST